MPIFVVNDTTVEHHLLVLLLNLYVSLLSLFLEELNEDKLECIFNTMVR